MAVTSDLRIFKLKAMKQVILSFIAIAAFGLNLKSQNIPADVAPLIPSSGMVIPADTLIKKSDRDTASVHIGAKDVKIITHEGGTEISWKKFKSNKFKGHWAGLGFGFNAFDKSDYSMYNDADKNFMSLKQEKSLEVNINFYELNIGLSKNNIGLVSGLGISFNNYRFDNPYTLKKGQFRTEPVSLNPDNLSKTKLAMTYLNVPILLECQIPVNQNEGRLFINAGLEGGVRIGSHTKVKYGNKKEKDHSGFNLNSFNYAATARIGYKDFGLFVNYSLSELFQSGEGPELTPFTIGIAFF